MSSDTTPTTPSRSRSAAVSGGAEPSATATGVAGSPVAGSRTLTQQVSGTAGLFAGEEEDVAHSLGPLGGPPGHRLASVCTGLSRTA